MKSLKGKLEEMVEEKDELNTKFSKLKCDLLYKITQMKDMSPHVEHLEEQSRKLAAENESVQVTKQEIIALLINRSRQRRSAKLPR